MMKADGRSSAKPGGQKITTITAEQALTPGKSDRPFRNSRLVFHFHWKNSRRLQNLRFPLLAKGWTFFVYSMKRNSYPEFISDKHEAAQVTGKLRVTESNL
jgi:hypothetical protein